LLGHVEAGGGHRGLPGRRAKLVGSEQAGCLLPPKDISALFCISKITFKFVLKLENLQIQKLFNFLGSTTFMF
jgi:hypothetical protein